MPDIQFSFFPDFKEKNFLIIILKKQPFVKGLAIPAWEEKDYKLIKCSLFGYYIDGYHVAILLCAWDTSI